MLQRLTVKLSTGVVRILELILHLVRTVVMSSRTALWEKNVYQDCCVCRDLLYLTLID
jgi:hypothetical protein